VIQREEAQIAAEAEVKAQNLGTGVIPMKRTSCSRAVGLWQRHYRTAGSRMSRTGFRDWSSTIVAIDPDSGIVR
jgi:hypothetical protein